MLLWIILAIICAILILIIIVVFALAIFYLYRRSASGVILFKIDYNNKRVIRLNPRFYFLSTIFDSKKSDFKMYKYIPLKKFLEYFDSESISEIEVILENQNNNFSLQDLQVFINNKIRNDFSFIDKLIFRFDRNFTHKKPYHMQVTNNQKGEFFCQIKWTNFRENKPLNIINNSYEEKTNIRLGSYIVLGFALKPHTLISNHINDTDLSNIGYLFNFNIKKSYFFNKDGMIYFLIKKNFLTKIEHYINKVKNINELSLYTQILLAATVFERKIDSLNQISAVEEILKFSLYNIIAKPDSYNEFLNKKLIEKDKEFLKFKTDLSQYLFINNNLDENFNISKHKILKYNSNDVTRLSVAELKCKNNFENNKNFILFKNNPYLNFIFQPKWNDFLSQKLTKKSKNKLFKISQEVFLQDNFFITQESPIPLVYSEKNIFDVPKLKQKISENLKKRIATTLYVNTIDKNLFNIINDVKLKAIVIGKDISKKIHLNNNIFLEVFSLVTLAKNRNILIIYEDVIKNIDTYIMQKAEVEYFYTSE
ncbi:MHO_4530 family protein [Mycoplasma sp. 4013]